MSGYGNYPFGINAIKLVRGATTVSLPVDRVLKFKERTISGELMGSGKIAAVATKLIAVDFELEAGGISLEAVAVMTGRTVVVAGTTPNESTKLTGLAAQDYPFFIIRGQALGAGTDDLHCYIYKAKLTDGLNGDFQDGQFFMSAVKGTGIDDGTNGIYDFIQHETAAALP
jgi:hypothetical protein